MLKDIVSEVLGSASRQAISIVAALDEVTATVCQPTGWKHAARYVITRRRASIR